MEEDIKVVVFDIYGVLIDREGNVDKEVLDLLRELRKKKLKLLLCSNTPRKMLEIWDRKYDYLKYFDDTILAESVQVSKPDPEIFKEIINHNTDIQPHNILFIDDKDENILGSEAEGLTGLRFKDVSTFKKDLEKLGLM